MGSRASAVVIENGKRHVYYDHGAAQFMDALMFWGPEHALAEVREWLDGREKDPNWDGEWWLDNVWAEGGCCIDLDNEHLILYGGEDAECDVLWLETYLKLLPYTWPGWSIEWSWGELTQIARYAGVEGKKLEEIDCNYTDYPSGGFLEEYIDYAFNIPKYSLPGASTLSITRNGQNAIAFTDETSPENMLFIGSRINEAIERLGNKPLAYDDDEFLMGGIHLDFDKQEIWLWRTWDNNIDIEGGGCNERVETKRVAFAYKILDRWKEGSLEGDAEARERTGHGGVRQEDDPRADARGGQRGGLRALRRGARGNRRRRRVEERLLSYLRTYWHYVLPRDRRVQMR